MEWCLSLILSFFIASAAPAPALAVDSDDLLTIAAQFIQVTQATDANGTVVTTYNNLNDFAAAVRNAHPEISDYEIATCLLDYVGEDYHGLPEEEILYYLNYDNITTSTAYIMEDNGYMQIVTNYSCLDRIGGANYYAVWARATWLKYPAMHMKDAFVLDTTGVFDSKYNEVGAVSQTFYCNQCHRDTHRDRFVDMRNPVDGDLVLSYENGVPTLSFTPIPPQCDYCSGGVIMDTYFSVYTRYGMIANETENIQARYAHKTLGLGSINIDKYITRAVKVNESNRR